MFENYWMFDFRLTKVPFNLDYIKSVWCWPSIMPTTKIFRAVQKYFKALGFYPPPQPNQTCEFNRKNVFYIFAVAGMLIPLMGFFLFKATSAYEYSVSFYMSIVMITMTTYCSVLIYKMGSIVKLIEKYEEFIKKRKPLNCFF